MCITVPDADNISESTYHYLMVLQKKKNILTEVASFREHT